LRAKKTANSQIHRYQSISICELAVTIKTIAYLA
jgi:hypothetical protein